MYGHSGVRSTQHSKMGLIHLLLQVLDTEHLPVGGKTLWVNDLKGEMRLQLH